MHPDRRSFVFGLLAAGALRSQTEETPLFRSDVSLVKVDARVSTPDGTDIPGLTQTDFVVFDENAEQAITHFASESDPVNVVLVLDVSPSMRRQLSNMAAKSGDALDRLRQGDRAGVLAFAERSEWIQPLTTEVKGIPRQIIAAIFRDSLGRTTVPNEALVEAARQLRSQSATGRRAIIVVTDNELSRGRVNDDAVVREIHSADAVLNAILMGKEPDPRIIPARYQTPSSGGPDVRSYAKATGGDVYQGDAPEQALDDLLKRALTRYSLHYPSPGGEPGAFRRIRVELMAPVKQRYPGAVVHARSGYETPR